MADRASSEVGSTTNLPVTLSSTTWGAAIAGPADGAGAGVTLGEGVGGGGDVTEAAVLLAGEPGIMPTARFFPSDLGLGGLK